MKKQKLFPLVFFVLFLLYFFKAFFLQAQLPIPSDTIIGLYHPFRDLYAKDYPNGIPFKNFLITDPIRQQYPWRELSIAVEKKFHLPLWNPYNFAGTPLLANFQTGAFYPLNLLFFFLPFFYAWSILIMLQPLLAGGFLFFYLLYLRLNRWASLLGAMVFAFSGFSIAWLEWNTIGHVALWLPIILLAKEKLLKKISFQWIGILIFAECSQIFAGHLQVLFYSLILSNVYIIARIYQDIKQEKTKKVFLTFWNKYKLFLYIGIFVGIVTLVQWLPTLQFIAQSARGIDQAGWQKEGWFIPWQHLIQFVAPDFFGNPTTLNYWGVWNYAEFIGYIGIFPLIMAIFALFFRRDKKTFFFGTFLFLSLIFSLPTIFAQIPFILNIPLLSTSQPTRLLFLTDFSLAILSALGFDHFLKNKKGIIFPVSFLALIFVSLWIFALTVPEGAKTISAENFATIKRNLIFPSILFVFSTVVIICFFFFQKRQKLWVVFCFTILIVTAFDLIRFGLKFTPFTNNAYLFPNTQTLSFLQKQDGFYRTMTTDDRILPPNFSIIYRLQSIDGYDPLYLQRYAELIAALQRGKPDIAPPFGFNRIITPHRYSSKIIDLLGVKYILSLDDISSPKLVKVFQEGQTRVYENKDVLPRAFFVEKIKRVYSVDKQQVITNMFNADIDFKKEAIIELEDPEVKTLYTQPTFLAGEADIIEYSENKVIIQTKNADKGFLVLTDSFYPTWKVTIDGKKTDIYRTNYNFRGVFVPEGNHAVAFSMELL